MTCLTALKNMMELSIKKEHEKCIFRVCLPTWKICAYGVFWKSFYKVDDNDIHPEIQVVLQKKKRLGNFKTRTVKNIFIYTSYRKEMPK